MSGVEILGVVASTFQLAEIGMKLSVKLCSFYRQIKDADHSAQRLASDVSLTCSILHQLGKTLEQDSQTKLCSQQAFLTAQEVLEECERIFKQIQDAIEKKDPGSGKSRWERGTRRLTIVILGPDLEVLKSHLDRLKSTMLLMLNVIMYAREINRTSDHSSLESQRQVIETLLQEKTETEARSTSTKTVNVRSDCDREGTFSSSTLQQPSNKNEIDKYYNLVKSLLNEIDACQTNLQPDRHCRIRDGVVNVHKAEVARFQRSHGEAALQAFDGPFFEVHSRDLDSSLASKPNSRETIENTMPTTGCAYSFSPKRHREYSHPPFSRSQNLWDDNHSTASQHSPSIDGKDGHRKVVAVEPPDSKESAASPKGILKTPRERFPEEPNPVREGMAPLKDAHLKSSSLVTQLTKIDRRLVSPQALEAGNEQYEERFDYVIVWRALSQIELEDYAAKTQEIRDERRKEYIAMRRRRIDEARAGRRHDNREELSIESEYECPNEPLNVEAPPRPGIERDLLLVRPQRFESSTRGSKPSMQQKPHWTQDTKRLQNLPSHPLKFQQKIPVPKMQYARRRLEINEHSMESQQKEYLRTGLSNGESRYGDSSDGESSADCEEGQDFGAENKPMEVDIPVLEHKAPDVKDSRRKATTSGKEGPRKQVAWGTLEDLVLSWTTLSRDMIRL